MSHGGMGVVLLPIFSYTENVMKGGGEVIKKNSMTSFMDNAFVCKCHVYVCFDVEINKKCCLNIIYFKNDLHRCKPSTTVHVVGPVIGNWVNLNFTKIN